MPDQTETENAPGRRVPPPGRSRLWLWFVAAFALQVLAWGTWFVLAARHRVQEVPIAGPVVPHPQDQEVRSVNVAR
jgi:hypothetical protein